MQEHERYLRPTEKPELININEKVYTLTHKPPDCLPSHESLGFVIDEWEKPKEEYNPHLNKSLSIRNMDFLKDKQGAIVALCSYSMNEVVNLRPIIGDGKISLTLVREDHRKEGLGTFLTKRAIDKIIESAKKLKKFAPPVKVLVEADSEEGANLIKKMQAEYKDTVLFDVEERYEDEED